MYCKYCAKEIEEKAEICVHCGRRVRSSITSVLENSEWTRLRPIKEPKSPGLAGFLGFFLGWVCLGPIGYLYLEQWRWFWITLAILVLALPVSFGTAWFIFPFIFAFHQYQMANELNDQLGLPEGHEERPAKTG
jgi:hypothetical protein